MSTATDTLTHRARAHADADTVDRMTRYTAIRGDGTRFNSETYQWAYDQAMASGWVVDHMADDRQHGRLAGDVLVTRHPITWRRGHPDRWITFPTGTEVVVVAILCDRRNAREITYLVELPGERLGQYDPSNFLTN